MYVNQKVNGGGIDKLSLITWKDGMHIYIYMERESTDWHELYRVSTSRGLDKDTGTCPPVPAVPGKDGCMTTSKDKTTADKTNNIMQ